MMWMNLFSPSSPSFSTLSTYTSSLPPPSLMHRVMQCNGHVSILQRPVCPFALCHPSSSPALSSYYYYYY